jgi:hypothetical protein
MRLRLGVAANVDIEQSRPVRPAAIQVVQPVDGNERLHPVGRLRACRKDRFGQKRHFEHQSVSSGVHR